MLRILKHDPFGSDLGCSPWNRELGVGESHTDDLGVELDAHLTVWAEGKTHSTTEVPIELILGG